MCVCVGWVHVRMCVGSCVTVESCAHMCANGVRGSAPVEPVTSVHLCIHAHICVDTRVFGSARVGAAVVMCAWIHPGVCG